MSNTPQEYLIEFDEGVDQAAAIEVLTSVGGRITHRFGVRTVVVSVDLPEKKVRDRLPAGCTLVTQPIEGAKAANQGLANPIITQAFRLRKSPSFREAKKRRPHDRKEWGEGGLEEPDGPEDESEPGHAVQERKARAAVVPTNERLVNDVAVGIVIVKGSGDTAISAAEKVNIVAEAQEGLDMLGNFEPNAKVTWNYKVFETTVNMTPWEGARWPGMPPSYFKGFDAALMREDNGKIYFFKGSEYVRFSNVSAGVDAGYPKPIKGNWKGLPASFESGIDAALWRMSNNKLYFFKGNEYVRFSKVEDGMDPGYPKPIAGSWPGMPADFNDGIDSALLRKDNGKIYMFKGEQYVRFSNVSQGVDAGYPKPIVDNWTGLPDNFAKPTQFSKGIDAALWRNSNDKVYFFKKARITGKYVRFSNVSDGVDEAYKEGVPIGLSGEEAEALWRDPALTALGFSKGKDGVKELVADLQKDLDTQWAYCGFFTKHPTVHFAYAGDWRVVMRWSDFSAGATGNMDRVFAHETGHIFGGPDEYTSSNCACGAAKGKFFKEPNANCAMCDPDLNVECIMRSNSSSMCPSTPWHFGWGAFMRKIDAAVWRLDSNKLYMFSNDKYIRFTDVSAGRDDGYPKSIAGNWPGLPNSFKQGIDAALWREDNGKLYFFKGSQYVRFSNVGDGVDAGYPKPIKDNWKGLPASFESGIDAALMRKDNHKIYFFKGTKYVRFSNVDDGVDPGYPAWINKNWMPFPE